MEKNTLKAIKNWLYPKIVINELKKFGEANFEVISEVIEKITDVDDYIVENKKSTERKIAKGIYNTRKYKQKGAYKWTMN